MKMEFSWIFLILTACQVALSQPGESKSVASCQCDPRCDCGTSGGLMMDCTVDASNPTFPQIPGPGCYELEDITITSDGPLHIPSRAFTNQQICAYSDGVKITANPLTFAPDAFLDFNNNSQYIAKVFLTNKQPDGYRDEVKFEGVNATLEPSGYHDLNFVLNPSLRGLIIDNSYDDMQISWPSNGIIEELSITGTVFPKTKVGNAKPIKLSITGTHANDPMANVFPGLYNFDFTFTKSISLSYTLTPGIITLRFGSMQNLTKVEFVDEGIHRIPSGTFVFPVTKMVPADITFGRDGSNIVIETGSFKNTGYITFSNNGNKIIHSGAFTNTGDIILGSNRISEIPSKAFANTGSIDLSSSRISNLSAGAFVNTGGVDLSNNNIRSIPGDAFNVTKGTINLQQNMIDQILPGSFIPPVGAIKLSKNKIQWIRAGVFDGVSRVELLGNPITRIDPYAFGNSTVLLQAQLENGANLSIDAFRLMEGEVFLTMGDQSPVTNAILSGSTVNNPPKSMAQLSLVCGTFFIGINCPTLDPRICSQLDYYQADTSCYCSNVTNLCS